MVYDISQRQFHLHGVGPEPRERGGAHLGAVERHLDMRCSIWRSHASNSSKVSAMYMPRGSSTADTSSVPCRRISSVAISTARRDTLNRSASRAMVTALRRPIACVSSRRRSATTGSCRPSGAWRPTVSARRWPATAGRAAAAPLRRPAAPALSRPKAPFGRGRSVRAGGSTVS